MDFGAYRLQFFVPEGWELIDHGKQKRFRRGEFEIVLERLDPQPDKPGVSGDPADRALAAIDHDDKRREVKSKNVTTLDGREALEIETWYRLDHSNPHKLVVFVYGKDLFVLSTVRYATGEMLKAFDAIRGSFHFVTDPRQ
jgi:hypothetical protein